MMNQHTNHNQQQVIYVTQGKSRVAYILLGLFFGGMGLHDFYAGFAGKGLLKLIISFLGIGFTFVGSLGAVATFASETADTPEEIALMPLFGLCLLGFQSLYILIQICTVSKDAKGVPFS